MQEPSLHTFDWAPPVTEHKAAYLNLHQLATNGERSRIFILALMGKLNRTYPANW